MISDNADTVSIVVFDLDGTLIDSLPDLAEVSRELLGGYGLRQPSDAEVRAMIGDGVRVLVERLLAASDAPETIDRSDATTRFMNLYGPRAAELTRPFPDTVETLELLRERGLQCAICTNKPFNAAQKILATLGLKPLIDAIAGGDTFPYRKPDPRHLIDTIGLLQGRRSTSIMVGDHRNDVSAASGAGIRSVFAEWGYGTPEMGAAATECADTISQLPDIVQSMNEERFLED